jgi:hypothetical protein
MTSVTSGEGPAELILWAIGWFGGGASQKAKVVRKVGCRRCVIGRIGGRRKLTTTVTSSGGQNQILAECSQLPRQSKT